MPVHLVEVLEVFDVQHRFGVTRPVLPPGEILFVFGSDIKMDFSLIAIATGQKRSRCWTPNVFWLMGYVHGV